MIAGLTSLNGTAADALDAALTTAACGGGDGGGVCGDDESLTAADAVRGLSALLNVTDAFVSAVVTQSARVDHALSGVAAQVGGRARYLMPREG